MRKVLKILAPATLRTRIRRSLFGVHYALLRLALAESFERVLTNLLLKFYGQKLKRDWIVGPSAGYGTPHFFEHRASLLSFVLAPQAMDPAPWSRAFLASELVRPGDRILDIGCGDGFFSMRFLAANAAAVDAVDIEPGAIDAARQWNSAPNVTYYLLDAVRDPFPGKDYDLVIWDGAIGHFSRESMAVVMAKIKQALNPGGVFAGSESLGREGDDHLQFFHTTDDLQELLAPHFRSIRLRERSYWINDHSFLRREAYWRCSDSLTRLTCTDWIQHSLARNDGDAY